MEVRFLKIAGTDNFPFAVRFITSDLETGIYNAETKDIADKFIQAVAKFYLSNNKANWKIREACHSFAYGDRTWFKNAHLLENLTYDSIPKINNEEISIGEHMRYALNEENEVIKIEEAVYPNNNILKTIYTDYVDSYKSNLKIEIVEISKADSERIAEIKNKMNRFCVRIEGCFIHLFKNRDKTIKILGWEALGFKTKNECKKQVDKIIDEVEKHKKLKDEEDQRKIDGKIIKTPQYSSIEKKFKEQWKIRL